MNVGLILTKPTIVLPGAWNTAIFSPEWIARFLHDYPVGQNVQANILQENQTGKTIVFIENIGVSPSSTRLEIFALSERDFPALGPYVRRIYEALPHTPCGSIGINFRYNTTEVSPEIIEKLETSEGIEADFEIRRQEIKTQLVRDERSVINLTRTYMQGSFEVDFNFHFEANDKAEIIEIMNGNHLEDCRRDSVEMLGRYYDVDEIFAAGFEFADREKQGG